MAIPTPVNGQITDSITQSNVATLAAAPTMAMGSIYQSAAHSTSILYQNAVMQQQQNAICAQAAANQGVIQIYSASSMAGASAASKVAKSDTATEILTMLVVLKALGSL